MDRNIGIVTKKQEKNVQRLALVIGNAEYENLPRLQNPKADATKISQSLQRLDFEVITHTNLRKKQIAKAIADFKRRLKKGSVSLFYYAGHGIQLDGVNYLIPIETELEEEYEVEHDTIDIKRITDAMAKAQTAMNIVILDACRDNPFRKRFRSCTRGLASMNVDQSIIIYAAAPGELADDGTNGNGLFTGCLLQELQQADNREIVNIMRSVTNNVFNKTGGRQNPYISLCGIREEFYFRKTNTALLEQKNIEKAPHEAEKQAAEIRRKAEKQAAEIRREAEKQAAEIRREAEKQAAPHLNIRSENIKRKAERITEPEVQNNLQTVNEMTTQAGITNKKIQKKVNRTKSKVNKKTQVEKTDNLGGFEYSCTRTYFVGGVKNKVKEYIHGKTGMEFVRIPAGKFTMGSLQKFHSIPPHRVSISEYFMSKYTVTQGLWKQVMGSEPWKGNKNVQEGEKYPAVYISWEDAITFCKKTQLSLPNEAQWEYACRAGTKSKYYWGNTISDKYFWYNKNTWHKKEKYAHEVGLKKANGYGLYDMSGNVWEWCEDAWHHNYIGAPVNGGVWIGSASKASYRVRRGGSFAYFAENCSSANRCKSRASTRCYNLGFRVCKSLSSRIQISELLSIEM